ncbi:MAG: hypothetical protein JXR75_12725 [Rhodobacteraceae bacterium]|nr:hypothetical protein [Paracoccaceae bacterium]
MEPLQTVNHDEIMRKARQMRAEALSQMFSDMVAWLHRKPVGRKAKV